MDFSVTAFVYTSAVASIMIGKCQFQGLATGFPRPRVLLKRERVILNTGAADLKHARRKGLNKHITVCRDSEETTNKDCPGSAPVMDEPVAAPCRVERSTCGTPIVSEHVGPEADSSATWFDESANTDCCDC